jgi:hypothetical protein
VLAYLSLEHGTPEHIRPDNGLELVAKAVRGRLSTWA